MSSSEQIFTKLRLARSSTTGAVPSSSFLDDGEIAINTFDGKIYYKSSDSSNPGIKEFAGQAVNLDNLAPSSIEFNVIKIPAPLTLSVNSIDWSLSRTSFVRNITGNTTFSFANVVPGKTISVIVKSNGNHTVTWPGAVKWPDATPPIQTPNGTDVYTFIAETAGTIYGAFVQQETISPPVFNENSNARIINDVLQLKDVVSGGWRTIWFEDGVLKIGASEQ
jgi:hypothetical protein